MPGSFQLNIMPYLSFQGRDHLRIGRVEFWSFDREGGSIHDVAIRQRIGELLAMYRQAGRDAAKSARLHGTAIVTVGPRDFRPMSDNEFEEIQQARHLLFLCCLSSNCLMRGPHAGHMMVTSENFELIRQNFVLGSPYISEVTGVLVQLHIAGYSIAETQFTKPAYVNLPLRFETDEDLLDCLEDLNAVNGQLFLRISRAAGMFLESYYNSPSVDLRARVLLQVTAFEILLDLPERGQRKAFKDKIETLLNTPRDRTYGYWYEVPGGFQRERRSLKGMWADRFYTLRNHIIHGEEVHAREMRFLRCQHHLQISPAMFTLCVKRLVDSELQAAGEPRRFFEQVEWATIYEGDEYEPRQVGFSMRIDFAARIQELMHRDEP